MKLNLPFLYSEGLAYTTLQDRIHGALACAVMGDALGAPTEQRSIQDIRQVFGGRVETFFKPSDDAPYARGRSAAQITDDSSQLLMLSEVLIANHGRLSAQDMSDMLIEWSGKPEYFPHFAGPSTRAAIDRLRNGANPESAGAEGTETTHGTSNGGAMRVAPAGLIHPGDPESAIDTAVISCRPSHFTSVGVSGAAAIAGAVAVALQPEVTLIDIVRGAIWSAEKGEHIGTELGREVAGPSVARRIELAARIAVNSRDLDTAVRDIAAFVGTGLSAAEAVPAAIGIFLAAAGNPWMTIVGAANCGDDTDTVACMAGSIAGAYAGFSRVPSDEYNQVLEANSIDLEDIAVRLTEVARASRRS